MRKLVPVVLLCAAACGDNGLVDPEEARPVDDSPDSVDVTRHLVPELCAVRAWPQIQFDKTDVDLSVVETPSGMAMFTVDRAGGELRGFAINHNAELSTKATGVTVRDNKLTAVSAAFMDEHLITASVADDGSVFVDVLRQDLDGIVNISQARGTMVADLPMAYVREDRFATIADDSGITGIRFDAGWQTSRTEQLSAKAPRSITATRYREDTMVSWSTESTCHLTRVAAERTSSRNFACVGARIAVDAAKREGFMVYAVGDTVMLGQIKVGGESELANTRVLVEHGTSPKIAFDGERFWIAYTNARRDVIIGYLSAEGSLVSMAVEGTRPEHDAYDITIVDGEVWMYAVDDAGVGAQRFCLKPL